MTAWITREPTTNELERFRLLLSVVNALPGLARQWKNGIPYPDFQLMEEAYAEAFGGFTPRAKDVFDVLAANRDETQYYGVQLKMKEGLGPATSNADLARTGQFPESGRLYFELSNQQAGALDAAGVSLEDLQSRTADPSAAGQAVIQLAIQQHENARLRHVGLPNGFEIDVESSVSILMTWTLHEDNFRYWLHSFPHLLPQCQLWTYTGENVPSKSIRGFESEDDRNANQQVYDWYFSSGGHLKWYPQIQHAIRSYGPFDLESVDTPTTLEDVTRSAFPNYPMS